MSHSAKPVCGYCHLQWQPTRHGRGGSRKYHTEKCARDKGCTCPPLHDKCREQVRVASRACDYIRVFNRQTGVRARVGCVQMRPYRVHHPPKDYRPIEESLPNEAILVTYPAANGKAISFVAHVPVPAKGSAIALASTIRNRSALLEHLMEHVAVPPNKRLKPEARPDLTAQLTSLVKRDRLSPSFAAAAATLDAAKSTLATDDQMELLKLLKYDGVRGARTLPGGAN